MFTYDTRPVELGQVMYVHIVLKPKTPKRNDWYKRNHRNETAETSKTTDTSKIVSKYM